MMSNILEERVVESKDWVTLIFLLALILIVITKTAFENRFKEFSTLLLTDKYLKIYKDETSVLAWFTLAFFIVQLISFSFFIHYFLSYFGLISPTDLMFFIQVITFLCYFILAKYLIEKIIATSFDIEDFKDNFDMIKLTYRTYLGILLVPITMFLYYNREPDSIVIYLLLGLFVFYNFIIYLKAIKIFQSLILGKLFYFILYLCALEIAPYYFLYYLFTKR